MKLISLKLKNINSLKGEHFIDFSAPPLSSCEMFLITGPTGSGKTTILDAITAALYDRTPRLSSKMTRALKSQTAETALIELCYSIRGENYKNIWQIDKRDNKKISVYKNGELLSALKVNALGDKTLELIGMDYDTFVKTIVLAQNKFDEFIKSRPEDRRKIIESITDNKVLEDVKKIIKDEYDKFEERYGALKQKLEALEAITGGTDLDALKKRLGDTLKILEKEKKEAEAAAKDKNDCETLKCLYAELDSKNGELKKIAGGYDFADKYREIVILRTVRDKFSETLAEIKNISVRLEAKKGAAEEKAMLGGLISKLNNVRGEYDKLKNERGVFNLYYSKKISDIATARTQTVLLDEISKKYEAVAQKCAAIKLKIENYEKESVKILNRLKNFEAEKKGLNDKKALYGPEFENSEEALFEFKSEIEKIKTLKLAIEKAGAEISKSGAAIASAQKRASEIQIRLDNNRLVADKLKKEKLAVENERERLENECELCETREPAAALREKLIDGEKCPVCGSLEHPDARLELSRGRDSKKIKAEIKAAEIKIKKYESDINAIEISRAGDLATLAALKSEIDSKTAGALIMNEEFNNRAADLKLSQSSLKAPFDIGELDYDIAAARWGDAVKFFSSLKDNLSRLENQIAISGNDKINAARNLAQLNEGLEEVLKESGGYESQKKRVAAEIEKLTGSKTPDEMENELEAGKKKTEKNFLRAESDFNAINSAIAAKTHLIENIEKEIAELEKSMLSLRAAFGSALRENGYEEAFIIGKYDELKKLSSAEAEYNERLMLKNNMESQIASLEKKIESKPFSESVLAELSFVARQKSDNVELLNRETGEITAALKKQQELLNECAAVKASFEQNNREHETLEKLYSLTKDNQFRDFVLSFYLKNLLLLANQYLKILTGGRYELLFDLNSANAIFIKDYFNEGREREINTVSGGEAFMASLSLALGLSQVSAGYGKIEFMFLDEGFGVLDSGALEDVLDMISRLNNIGRRIGIISHIQQVKERIDVRIELIKNNDGSSNIKIY